MFENDVRYDEAMFDGDLEDGYGYGVYPDRDDDDEEARKATGYETLDMDDDGEPVTEDDELDALPRIVDDILTTGMLGGPRKKFVEIKREPGGDWHGCNAGWRPWTEAEWKEFYYWCDLIARNPEPVDDSPLEQARTRIARDCMDEWPRVRYDEKIGELAATPLQRRILNNPNPQVTSEALDELSQHAPLNGKKRGGVTLDDIRIVAGLASGRSMFDPKDRKQVTALEHFGVITHGEAAALRKRGVDALKKDGSIEPDLFVTHLLDKLDPGDYCSVESAPRGSRFDDGQEGPKPTQQGISVFSLLG